MSTLQMHFRSMARNNLWSNHRLHRACAQLSPEACAAQRGAFFGSILGTLNHILLVDRWYLGQLTASRSEPMLRHGTMLHAELQSLSVAQLASDRGLIEFCDALDPERLARVVESASAEGGPCSEPCSDPVHTVLGHLFIHQIHHRGQVHQMLCTTSVPAPQLDEFFLSGDAALREAELDELGLRL